MKRKKTKAQLKQEKRERVRSIRRRNGWKPPKGMVIYADRY